MSWPTIQQPSSISETYEKAQIKSRFESGRVYSRVKHQIPRHIWSLQWSAMSRADLNALKAAFNADIGTTFSWEHPVDGTFTVRYSEDSISGNYSPNGYSTVTVDLEQA